ncbi:ATP-binding protein [Dokdonella sp.]|uniref:ATP-binding response regulator n=1 Tax=Dokdonella sp. TaxID=2291710 RepID=UPI0025C4807F|nr:ATP-binding protein [Dokdonella sp.]
MPALPSAVEDYLRDTLMRRAHPLLLSFGDDWQLRELHGDPAVYGLDAEHGLRELQDLFIGLPLDGHQDLPFVEFSNGRSAHVHLIADAPGFHVLLLDAEEERERQRAQQQLGHDAVLTGHEQSKAIGRLTEIRNELERQRASLEEANALKNALIATLSHEFRTPLTSIFGYLHLLERRLDGSGNAAQALQAVRRNATYLFTLAENLLEYGRGESGAALLNPVEVDLTLLARDLDAMFRPLAEDKGVAFRVDLLVEETAPPVFDEVRLRQIVVNLLSNAVRYTTKGEIACDLVWRDGRLSIDVADSGIGISAEFRDSVFKPFNRGGQSGSKGAGLGLSIVRRLIEQMRGELRLESELGRGTRFRVELPPLARAAAKSAASHAAPFPRGVQALVVDDDPDIAQLLEVLLIDLGFEVRVAENASQAIAEATRQPPDVLLIDVELPGLSGNAAVFQLRSHGYRGRIVTLSATSTGDARDASLRAGADHYLTKPLNLDQFVGVMQRALQGEASGQNPDADRRG